MRTTLLFAGLMLGFGSLMAQQAQPPILGQPAESFDIRLSDQKIDVLTLERLQARNPVAVARARSLESSMLTARAELLAQPAGLQVIAAPELGTPEIVSASRGVALTSRSAADREVIARGFLESNAGIYGLTESQAGELLTDVSYANPAGNLEWVRLLQKVNDLPVFRGEVTVALTPNGEVVRTMGQLAAAIDPSEAVTRPSVDANVVLLAQAQRLGVVVAANEVRIASRSSDGHSVTLNAGVDNPEVKADLVYFPLGKGVLELAWSMVIQTATPDAYYTLVSATDGSLLFQKNTTNYDSYTYNIYNRGNPAPFIPGPVNPTLGQQAPRIASANITLESQSITGDPWLPAGATVTNGNNVEAGLDIDGTDGVDAPLVNSSAGNFIYLSNPAPGMPAPGEASNTATSRKAAVVNLFYWTNRFHDLTYDLGFTEAARNFQQDNYGRGAVANDRIRAEAQDSSGTSNANFNTPADGGRGRMQMYVFTNTTPSRDGSLDADIIIHEFAHGLSNRLHGNASGLSSSMASGMGEGWGDYYAYSFLASPLDPIDSIYTTGGYSTYQLTGGGDVGNYYYGIRRFPTAIIAAKGGPQNRPFNPLTFADVDSAQISLLDGAYPRGPIGSASAGEVHNSGEIWTTTLWEARAKVIGLSTPIQGNQRMLQLVTDGMKLSPINPTMLQGRDAIIAADCAGFAGVDEIALWQGFALRGMGFSAKVISASSLTVVEAFDLPIGGGLMIGDWTNQTCPLSGRNPTPGETIQFQLNVTNTFCATNLTNVKVAIPGGATVVIGNLSAGQTVTPTINYTIPGDSVCGTVETVQFDVSSDAGTQSYSEDVSVGLANIGVAQFSNATLINVPAGQPGTSVGAASPYPSTINVAGFDNITHPVTGIEVVLDPMQHTYWGDVDMLLVGPGGQKMVIMSDSWSGFDTGAPERKLTISDSGAALMPASGAPDSTALVFRPTNQTAGDTFAGAPAGPYQEAAPAGTATFANQFAGVNPNGNWSLYIVDDASGDSGKLNVGWTLRLLYAQASICESCDLDIFKNGFEN